MITIPAHSIKKKMLYSSVAAGIALMIVSAVQAEEPGAGTKASASVRSIEEVIVTARRREESAQDTPVAVSALNREALYRQNITDIDDLTSSVPGVNFTASGGANNTVFSIRGRSRGVFGNALPAVTTYVNEVPLSTWGGNIPSFDMASLQVLKGPQGTLFGRNSTAGAVLVTTERPSHEFGGYVMAKIGEYNSRILEGAVNIPIIQDKIALRIAGQTDDRDGHTEDMTFTSADDFGNHDRENFRVSLLVEPLDNLSNLTIYENNKTDERGPPTIAVGFDLDNPFTAVAGVPYYNGSFTFTPSFGILPCGGDPNCDAKAMQARQESAGVRKAWGDNFALIEQELTSWGNITTLDAGSFTVKNVFGYREVDTYTVGDIDGSAFPMINSDNIIGLKQYSNELQITGEALDGALEYIGGVFWLKSEPQGQSRLTLQLFAQSGTPFDSLGGAPFNGGFGASDFYTDTSKAVFGQVSYDLSAINDSLAGFSVDVGLRHTKDKSESCPVGGTHITVPAPTISDCTVRKSAEFNKTTYNLGLNYQVNDDVLLYAVTRTGYRAGGVNSPNLGGTLSTFQSYEPEEVQDIELGLKSDWNLGDIYGRLNVALYHSEYEGVHFAIPTSTVDQILPGGVDGDGDPANNPSGGLFYGNAGDATVEGIEVELIVHLMEGLEVTFGGSYLDKEFDPEITLPSNFADLPPGLDIVSKEDIEAFVFLGAPDWSYTVAADYILPLDSEIGEVILSVNYFRISGIHYGGDIFASEYSKTDVRVDWLGILGTSLDAAFYVENATDEEAILGPSSSSSGLGFNSAIYNDPRMWGVSLRYSF